MIQTNRVSYVVRVAIIIFNSEALFYDNNLVILY